MACHAHLFCVHCTNNDTAIPDRSNCNPLHQEKAATTGRLNCVLVRKCLLSFTASCGMDEDGLGDDVHMYCDPGPQGDDTQVAWANCMISLPLNVNCKGGWGPICGVVNRCWIAIFDRVSVISDD